MSEETKEKVKLNLYQKISAVMNEVQYLSKDGQISFKSTNYKAITEEKVTSSIRSALIKHGLVILPVEQEHSKDGTLSTVNTKYKIVDTETGESEIIVSSGTGADTQDKGVGKAMTYSYKYLLLRTFAIPTGEDPDKVSSAELDAKEKEPITQKQVGEIKTTVLKLAEARSVETDTIYSHLKIKDITKLTSKDAESTKGKLTKWLKKAEEEQEQGAV